MRKLISILSATSIILTSASYISAEPQIHFEDSLINISDSEILVDIGQVENTAIVSHEFQFRNKGSSTLIIKSLEACCGRRAELLTDEKTAPGETGKIKFTFITRNRSGEILERFVVNTNEPGKEKLKINVRVEVNP